MANSSTSLICFTPCQDAYIAQYYPNTNFGCIPYLYTNLYKSSSDEYQSLIQFNLCSLDCNQIPPNSHITCAKLCLKIYRNEVPNKTRLYAYRIKQAWDEFSVTWDHKPAVDYSNPVGYVDVCSGYFGWVEMEIDYSLVQSWYNGCCPNYGLLLKCDEPCNSLIGFYSREFSDPDYWPRLMIYYYVNCCHNTNNNFTVS
ncbi:DNRLRE domain-containing protein [Thermosyntropha sp.]|uniref:DNRLRE domain-containing protein n=1 Tax=Thermosyntropha sp. TaxID=2740820 RepID=UPI0025D49797|nr:DNRLRE domain-containing protein [Thermosyntropha sp.]MBO8159586.1 DNRLRE domain-containing protein [Thermosyntropha sp.]